VDPQTVARVAEYDYGYRADLNVDVLDDIRRTGLVPAWLPFATTEVLGLGRWEEGPGVDHVERAWCCALLCLYTGLGANDLDECAPVLVESCLALGPEPAAAAEALFAWLAEADHHFSEYWWDPRDDGPNAVALLALLLLRVAADPHDRRIGDLARLVLTSGRCGPDGPAGLLRSTRAGLWRELVDRVLVPARTGDPDLGGLVDRLLAGDH
jgi:hypothetical protein